MELKIAKMNRHTTEAYRRRHAQTRRALRGIKVVIVDDSLEALMALSAIFDGLKCAVFESTDPLTAVQMVAREKPDLVITDYHMPGMNGYEFIRRVRQQDAGHHTPFIILSGSQKSDSLLEVFAQDSIYYVKKPISREKLAEAAEELLGGYFDPWERAPAAPAPPDASDVQIERFGAPLQVVQVNLLGAGDVHQLSPSVSELELKANDASVTRKVNHLIMAAIARKASDVHIEPQEGGLAVRLRIDGQLVPLETEPLSSAAGILSRIKIMASLDIAERRLPQDGRFSVQAGEGGRVDLRVSTLPCKHGEKAVLRLLGRTKTAQDLGALGLAERDLGRVRAALDDPHGLILVTGPTGSGKTTTLYSMLSSINAPHRNIVTAEDPIELELSGINQVQVNSENGLTFAKVLRAFLRQDPDVMLVGEIRDAETAEIALKAAVTGHLVLSTLHTNDAPAAALRLADMGVASYLIGAAARLIIAQRLIRRLCPHCKVLTPLQDEEAVMLGEDVASFSGGVYRGKGCGRCHRTGYSGRVPVAEVMPVSTEAMRALLTRGAEHAAIRQLAVEEGMTPLASSALALAKQGVTSLSEALRTATAD